MGSRKRPADPRKGGRRGAPRTPGSGRKKGTSNKNSGALKEMILGALEDAGGRAYLKTLAVTDARSFSTLVGKLIPREVQAEIKGSNELIERILESRERAT